MSVAAVAVLAACGGGSPAAPGTPRPAASTGGSAQSAATGPSQAALTTPPPAPIASAPAAGGTGSVIHVVVGSGPQAGTYDASGLKSDCNIADDGSGASYSDMSKAEGVNTVVFTTASGGPAPKPFYFQVLFAPFSLNQAGLEISTLDQSAPRGSGTASLEDKGSTIKWTIDGKTADNVPVTATIECGPVDRR
jgi:hypothetical protein